MAPVHFVPALAEGDPFRERHAGDVSRFHTHCDAVRDHSGDGEAVRAVARANGANQIALVIPCHRVIGADGALTGYGGGLWRKERLIALERRFAERAA